MYATPEWEIHAFVEVDLGTESPSRFAQKIPAYVAAYRSGSWRAQLPAWPLVLTVAPTIARATALRRATEDALRRERHPERLARATEFDFAALPDLCGPHGPLGPIWQIAERSGGWGKYFGRIADALEAHGVKGFGAHKCRHQWATMGARTGTTHAEMCQEGGWERGSKVPSKYIDEIPFEEMQRRASPMTAFLRKAG